VRPDNLCSITCSHAIALAPIALTSMITAPHGMPTGSVTQPLWYMQDAGLVLLHMLRAHAAAYRAIKKMPGIGLRHACTFQPCAVPCRAAHTLAALQRRAAKYGMYDFHYLEHSFLHLLQSCVQLHSSPSSFLTPCECQAWNSLWCQRHVCAHRRQGCVGGSSAQCVLDRAQRHWHHVCPCQVLHLAGATQAAFLLAT